MARQTGEKEGMQNVKKHEFPLETCQAGKRIQCFGTFRCHVLLASKSVIATVITASSKFQLLRLQMVSCCVFIFK